MRWPAMSAGCHEVAFAVRSCSAGGVAGVRACRRDGNLAGGRVASLEFRSVHLGAPAPGALALWPWTRAGLDQVQADYSGLAGGVLLPRRADAGDRTDL